MNEINKDTYETISDEFSESRAYIWKCMKDFTEFIEENSKVIEIGCGNGKNMEYVLKRRRCEMIGIDFCNNFVKLCLKNDLNVMEGVATDLKFDNNYFDNLICIAMFHHLLTEEERIIAMKEFIRIMKSGALGIITCWSVEQPEDSKFKFQAGINEVIWKGRKELNKMRYYYVYTEKMFKDFFNKFVNEIDILDIYNEVGNWIIIFRKH